MQQVNMDYPESFTIGFADTTIRNNWIWEQTLVMAEQGFLTAYFNAEGSNQDTLRMAVEKGPQVKWTILTVNEQDQNLFSAAGYRPADFNDKPYQHQNAVALLRDIATGLANKGYPFASVHLDSFFICR